MVLCLPIAHGTGVGPEAKSDSKVDSNDVPDPSILKGDAAAPNCRAFLKKNCNKVASVVTGSGAVVSIKRSIFGASHGLTSLCDNRMQVSANRRISCSDLRHSYWLRDGRVGALAGVRSSGWNRIAEMGASID